MKRRWTIVSSLLIAAIIIYASFYLGNKNNTTVNQRGKEEGIRTPENSNIVVTLEPPGSIFAIRPDDLRRIAGASDAIVKVILFADFSNSSSIDALRSFLKIQKERDTRVSLYLYNFPVYKNELSLPLSNLFIESVKKNKMNDFVKWITEKDSLSREDLKQFINSIGIKPDSVFSDYKGLKIPAIDDMNLGINFGVNFAPSYFINGLRIDGNKMYEEIARLVDEQVSKAEQLVASGINKSQIYEEIIKNGKTVAYQIKVTDRNNQQNSIKDANLIKEETLRFTPYRGERFAPVTLVLFVDYECPYSKRFYPTIKSAIEEYGKDLRVFVKHFPLSSHKKSISIAKILASALYQKKFWVLFDKVMQEPGFTDEDTIYRLASDLGLNIDDLKKYKDSNEIEKYTARDIEESSQFGIKTLPTIYVNGVRYEGVMSKAKLFRIIEIEREFARKLLKEGISMENLYDEIVERNRLKNIADMGKILKKPYIEKIR